MPVLCQQAAQYDAVLHDMFLKQSQTFLRNIVPEQLIQWSYVTLKLNDIASFVIKRIKARGERKTKSSSYPRRWDLMILCLTNMVRDKMNGNIVFNALFHLSLNYIFV